MSPRPAPLFRFVDLFAGIGGMRLGFESIGGQCVYSVEWDRYARQTYSANFGSDPEGGDIRQVARLPEHDILLAGFPCQPFSIAGVSEKTSLGRPHGFLDQTQGTLFFEVARLLRDSEPGIFVIEIVKNLLRHDRGRTFQVIKCALDELGYEVTHRIIDSRPWVPQRRERVYIVGLRRNLYGGRRFQFPEAPSRVGPVMAAILEHAYHPKYLKSEHVWAYLKSYQRKHAAAGNGFGYGLVGPGDVARTLSARYYKDGSEILVKTRDELPPRMLTPRECARLMGFPEEFRIVVSDTQAYKQFGNAVVVPVVEFIARAFVAERVLPVPREPIHVEQGMSEVDAPIITSASGPVF